MKADLWLQNNPPVPLKYSSSPFDARHSISSLWKSGQALAHPAGRGKSVSSCIQRAFCVKASIWSVGSTEATKETAAPRSKNAIDAIAASTRDVVDTSIQGQIASQIGAKSVRYIYVYLTPNATCIPTRLLRLLKTKWCMWIWSCHVYKAFVECAHKKRAYNNIHVYTYLNTYDYICRIYIYIYTCIFGISVCCNFPSSIRLHNRPSQTSMLLCSSCSNIHLRAANTSCLGCDQCLLISGHFWPHSSSFSSYIYI